MATVKCICGARVDAVRTPTGYSTSYGDEFLPCCRKIQGLLAKGGTISGDNVTNCERMDHAVAATMGARR
ncbi:hypothetical protein [Bradyrhizobium sp. MOS002]|uniref:hypothetical protein n=1 Tax=Bradyrhizobium sp. MOS002 TaxID=2133947 RepID=UPI000D135486|nr:hypothetical protein [Bradyrhizobium sp. MOS002]PSO19779.1 hypothetical protein C7G41_35290 [Bradyrhizobium sp. MOS002]